MTTLGRHLAALSATYNDPKAAPKASSSDALHARLLFSFPRDVPKGAAAVRELVGQRALALDKTTLRVIDLGAGLGAMTWGLARALDAAGWKGTLDVLLIDNDEATLAAMRELFTRRSDAGGVRIEPRLATGSASDIYLVRAEIARGGPVDVVILGQVLSELDRTRTPDERVTKHAAVITTLMREAVAPDGALVVVEPALKDRSRHLHRVRDLVLMPLPPSGKNAKDLAPPVPPRVFAPCLHAATCPALAHEGDWCHEDLEIDLPPWLVAPARAAGLRWQGLTFSYLVLKHEAGPSTARRLRVISAPIVTKGKIEAFLCGDLGEAHGGGGRLRAVRLDRDRADDNAAWDALAKGDVLEIEPAPAPAATGGSPRIGKTARVMRIDVAERRK
ncbi:MAG: Methyltransferase [Myxococcaceae bacterium]|nr:Methyltransferase [Myxococcaceae bacterium]